MQTLNLNDYTLDNGKVRIDHFPDGQVNVHLEGLDRKDGALKIIHSLKSSDDIMMLLMAVDIAKRNGMIIEELHIPYLYGARMDRVMDFGQPYTLKIVADLINTIEAEFVFIYDVHNIEKSQTLIKNTIFESPLECYQSAPIDKDIYIVYPDKGAYTRYFREGTPNYIRCSKVRDPKTNLLSGFAIDKVVGAHNPKELRIIDDLCDGGGTFCGVAKLLSEKFPNIPITLCVTHLIQPSAIKKVIDSGVSKVITTNSYFDRKDIPSGYEKKVVICEIGY